MPHDEFTPHVQALIMKTQATQTQPYPPSGGTSSSVATLVGASVSWGDVDSDEDKSGVPYWPWPWDVRMMPALSWRWNGILVRAMSVEARECPVMFVMVGTFEL
jgi:hypothetical protein